MPTSPPSDPPRWRTGEQLPPAEAALLAGIRDLLAEHTALTAAQLAEQPVVRELVAAVLGTDEPASREDASVVVEDLLEDAHTGIGWIIDGRHFLPERVTRGTVVTLRVTADLLADGDVFDGPDVAPLALTDRYDFPLAGGGEAQRTMPAWEDMTGPEAFRFELPVAAMPVDTAPGDLLALTWDGQELSLELVDEPAPATTTAAADALGATFEQLLADSDLLDPGDPVESQDLVAAARIDHGLFEVPLLPVTELAEATGLSVLGDHVAAGDHDWEAWSRKRRETGAIWQLAEAYDLSQDQAATVLAVRDAVEREAAALGDAAGRAATEEPAVDAPVGELELPPLLAVFMDPDVVRAVASATAYDARELAPGLAALAERLGRIARGRDQATTHHLAAVAAEAQLDVEEAARRSALAVRADAQHAPAAQLAARLAAIQGRASEALRHLQGAFDLREDNPLVVLLRTHAEPGPTDAGRNEPCPCGSGRKHKVCCGPANGWPLSERVGWLLAKLRDHVTGPLRIGQLADVAEVMAGGIAGDVPEAELQDLAGNAFVQGLVLWEGGLLEEYLDAYGPLLPADELDLARQWQDTPLDLWEVTEVRPGEGISLLGLYRGASVDVRERTFSHTATVGQTILARVLDATDHHELQAAWPVALQQREYLLTTVLPDDPGPMGWAAALAPGPIEMTNQDGEAFVHHTVRYALDVAPTSAAATLDETFGEADEEQWTWSGDEELLVRGFLWLEDGELVAVTNSDERRDGLAAVLADAFGGALVEASATAESIDELGARLRASGVLPSTDDDLPEGAEEALSSYMRDAEERWVDEAVPALGGLTPREALDDPTRRGDLLALLDEFDQYETSGSGMTMDADRLRDLLGLTD